MSPKPWLICGLLVGLGIYGPGPAGAEDELGTEALLAEARSLTNLIKRFNSQERPISPGPYRILPGLRSYGLPYSAAIKQASSRYGIPEALIAAVIKCESNWDPRAISKADARGLMQVLPRTALGSFGVGPSQLWDPDTNIQVGTAYLALMATRYKGQTAKVIAAYNAGPGRVDRNRRLPAETLLYARCVQAWHGTYHKALTTAQSVQP